MSGSRLDAFELRRLVSLSQQRQRFVDDQRRHGESDTEIESRWVEWYPSEAAELRRLQGGRR